MGSYSSKKLKRTQEDTVNILALTKNTLNTIQEIKNWRSVRLDNVKDIQNRWNLMHLAAHVNNFFILDEMITLGSNTDDTDSTAHIAHQDTPLHIAAFSGNREAVQLLLNKGAKLSLKNHVFPT